MCRQEGSVAINMSGREQHVLGQTGLRDLTLINTKKQLLPSSVFLKGNKMIFSASKFGQNFLTCINCLSSFCHIAIESKTRTSKPTNSPVLQTIKCPSFSHSIAPVLSHLPSL